MRLNSPTAIPNPSSIRMTRRTETRFLIITHHAITMSRMDRLFGVTMVERGVSQLVSVDLHKATELVDAA